MFLFRHTDDFDHRDRFVAHSGGVIALARRPRAAGLVSVGRDDGAVRFWDPFGRPDGGPAAALTYGARAFGATGPLAWSLSGSRLAVAAGRRVFVVRASTRKAECVLDFQFRVVALTWPAAGLVALLDDSMRVFCAPPVFPPRPGAKKLRTLDVDYRSACPAVEYDRTEDGPVRSAAAALGADGREWVAAAGRTLHIARYGAHDYMRPFGAPLSAASWTAPGTILLGTDNGHVFRFEIGDPDRQAPTLYAAWHDESGAYPHADVPVTAVSDATPAPEVYASGDADGAVVVWDKDRPAAVFHGHAGAVTGLVWLPDGRGHCLVSAGHDGTIRLWTVALREDARPGADPPGRLIDI